LKKIKRREARLGEGDVGKEKKGLRKPQALT